MNIGFSLADDEFVFAAEGQAAPQTPIDEHWSIVKLRQLQERTAGATLAQRRRAQLEMFTAIFSKALAERLNVHLHEID